MSTESIIKKAIDTAEVLTVTYHGGSQPGKSRQITPLQINKDRVRARCLTSNTVKVFMLEKIELSSGSVTPIYQDKPVISYQSLNKFHEAEKLSLEGLGWTVVLNQDSLDLHTRFKNGNLRKSPEAMIFYEEPEFIDDGGISVTMALSEDGFSVQSSESRPSRTTRPWKVWAQNGGNTLSYSKPEKAFNKFLEQAKEFAPK